MNKWKTLADIPANTELSDRGTKDLKQRGFKFVGTTILYAHLQASGLVNDHVTGCFRYREIIEGSNDRSDSPTQDDRSAILQQR